MSSRKRHGLCVGVLLVLVGFAGVVQAKITIRRHASTDVFFFHGNYSAAPFTPADGFGMEIWNCDSGDAPFLVTDSVPLILCDYDPQKGYTFGTLAYAVEVPPGVCEDHGRSCYYRNPDVPFRADGIRSLKIQYAHRGHGNRVWLKSYGNLSAADQAQMLLVIKVNGQTRATLQSEFTPLPNGGWYSPF